MKSGRSRESGVAIMEFALVLPILITLMASVVEFGVGFSRNLDVRHGAREGARLAAVNYSPLGNDGSAQTSELVAEICRRVDGPTQMTVSLWFVSSGDDELGDFARIEVAQPFDSVTGLVGPLVDGMILRSQVEFRLEQDATWAETSEEACP